MKMKLKLKLKLLGKVVLQGLILLKMLPERKVERENDMKCTQFTDPQYKIFVTSGYKAKDPGISWCHNNNL